MTGKRAVTIVAHPDDETLWAGGTILLNRKYNWTIFTLCRRGDPDRAPKFFRVLAWVGAEGNMGDLDDDPEQIPLPLQELEAEILASLIQEQVLRHSRLQELTAPASLSDDFAAYFSAYIEGIEMA